MGKILIKIVSNALGDNIGAMPCIEAYRKKTGNEVYVISKWKRILDSSYPEVRFVENENGDWKEVKEIFYKFELPLQEGYAMQLGFEDWKYIRPKVNSFKRERPIKAKYVSLGIHSTAQCKYWNYPDGWNILCKKLRKMDLTPVCIDQYELFGAGSFMNQVPSSSVRRLDNSIETTINYIEHSEFFIGISSGLSWVAHGLGKKVVMISGVTTKNNEFFEDCLRIIDEKVCHGCINNPKYTFSPSNWIWCPEFEGTERMFECTKSISPEHVMERILEEKFI